MRFILLAVLIIINLLFHSGCNTESESSVKLIDGTGFPPSAEKMVEIVKRWDKEYYQNEILARKAESKFVQLWDAINFNRDDWFVLKSYLADSKITFPQKRRVKSMVEGIDLFVGEINEGFSGKEGIVIKSGNDFIESLADMDIEIVQLELRQNEISKISGGEILSHLYGTIYLRFKQNGKPIKIDVVLEVRWRDASFDFKGVAIKVVKYVIQETVDFDSFGKVLEKVFSPSSQGYPIGPLIIQDLNGDYFPEVSLPGANKVIWNNEGELGRIEELCKFPRPLMAAAAVVSLFNDKTIQLIASDTSGIWLWRQNVGGKFIQPPEMIWKAPKKIRGGINFSIGDTNNDGLQDIWFGQYRPPYTGGQMPTPFYDANDGEPFYLLKQTKEQSFVDVTEEVGLGEYRFRRAFAGSFVDLDQDQNLDLIVTSDFSGLDLYWNKGDGAFLNANKQMEGIREGFGMSHLVTDANQNGIPEILMTGMNVPTVERLNASNSYPSKQSVFLNERSIISQGNRWFEVSSRSQFSPLDIEGPWQRTGWAWGVENFDYDNDGFDDYYLTNGHESSKSTADYESYFWCYDIYLGNSISSPIVDQYFKLSMPQTRGAGYSYGGYEVNRFLKGNSSQDRASLIDINLSLGLADQSDSRAVVAADLNLDGCEDLIYTTFEVFPQVQQKLKVVYNSQSNSNSWVGLNFHLYDQPPGTKVTLRRKDNESLLTRWMIYGESYRSQSPWCLKFGLGKYRDECEIEVTPANGLPSKKFQVEPNQYHIFKNE